MGHRAVNTVRVLRTAVRALHKCKRVEEGQGEMARAHRAKDAVEVVQEVVRQCAIGRAGFGYSTSGWNTVMR